MKLALKLVAFCMVAMILITAFSSYFIAKREYRLAKEAQESNAERVAGLIRESLELVYNSEGNQGIIKVIKTHAVDSGDIKYRWVWFDVSKSDSNHPSAPMESLKRIMEGEMGSVVDQQEGPDFLHSYYPLDVNDQAAGKPRKGAIEVTGSLAQAEQEAWDTTKKGLYAIVAMIAFCFAFIALAGIRFIGRPLKRLTDQTKLIGEGVYDHPIAWKRNDEFGQLAHALNAMSEKISGQRQQLRHVDRLKTVGRLAAGVAHEMGTPLNVISGRAGLIRSGKLTPQEMDESAAAIQSEANRIASIVRQLMDFARLNTPQPVSTDLRIVVDRTIELLRTIAEKNSVTIESSLSEQLPFTAFVDESRIQQVLTNIIVNAIQAMPDGGQINVQLSNVAKDGANHEGTDEPSSSSDESSKQFVLIEIQDNGPGMDEAMRDQIFEPFYTTKDVGQGTGLGLSIAHGIVQEHGGEITVESQPGCGTTFRIWLPKKQKDRWMSQQITMTPRRKILLMIESDLQTREKPHVLIVEDEQSMAEMLATDFRLRGIESKWCANADAAISELRLNSFDVVLTDINMPGTSGLQLCDQITRDYPDLPVIVMTAFGSMETAVSAIRAGAYDFVTKPVELELLALTINRAVKQRRLHNQVTRLSKTISKKQSFFGDLIGESPPMLELYDQLERISGSETSILLTGESGTGKELVARTIHQQSHRQDQPFVAINCGALPEALLESELFGHVKGAFTDARADREGLFREAEGGTMFLDEIGEMPPSMQVKLLRVLEEGSVRPVGGNKEIKVNVRLLSATNLDLESAIETDKFREDLYYRINVIQIELPALRSRGTDALKIGQQFVKQFAKSAKKEVTGIAAPAAERLLNYSWPGNVRELRNVIERAVALTRHDQIVVEDLPEKIRNFQSRQFLIGGTDPEELLPMEEIERRYILHVLDSVEGNKSTAARILSLDRKTLYRKLKQYGVESGD